VTSPDPEYLTVAEAAAVLRVNKRTVYRRIQDGRLPTHPIGRPMRVYRSAVTPKEAAA
jgi:excisionase family DNA binding protein